MRYEDVLEQCLATARRGEDVEPLIAAHPQFAEQLRLDLAAAASARRVATALPGIGPTTRQAFRTNLAQQRQQQAARKQRSFWPAFRMPALALAAASAVVVIVAAVLVGGIFSTNTAEASTIEGVVVQNDSGTLTVQTDTDIQTIEVQNDLTVNDSTGAAIDLASLEPGQLVVIHGKPGGARVFRALRIELRAANDLLPWCQQHPIACREIERNISQRVSDCAADQLICQRIRDRLDQIKQQVNLSDRLQQLKDSCDGGTQTACREIVGFCQNNPGVCDTIRAWLRSRRLS